MIRQIEARGKATLARAGLLGTSYSIQALYAQYRVLSQLTHASLLGMAATVQPDEEGTVAVGRDLPPAWRALLLHTAAASAVNVAAYTVREFEDDPGSGRLEPWALEARMMVFRLAELIGPIHGLTTSLYGYSLARPFVSSAGGVLTAPSAPRRRRRARSPSLR